MATSGNEPAKCFNLTIDAECHPWTPTMWARNGQSECVPWGRWAYLWIPFDAFLPMGTSFRHLDARDAMKTHVQNVTQTMDLFGSLAAMLASYGVQHTSDGDRKGPFQMNTMTVCYGKDREGKQNQVVGFIWAIFRAQCEFDNNDLKGHEKMEYERNNRRLRNDPVQIIKNQTRTNDDKRAESITGIVDMKKRTGPKARGGGNKKEVPTYFQTMTEENYKQTCRTYIPVPVTHHVALDPVQRRSTFHFWNVFTLRHALIHAARAGAHTDFFKVSNWEQTVPPVGPGLPTTEFGRPRNGSTTTLLRGVELDPRHLVNCLFPHVQPPLPNPNHPGLIALISRYYDGARDHHGVPAPITEADEKDMAAARARAESELRGSLNGVDAGFTMDVFEKAALESYETNITKHFRLAAKKHRALPPKDPSEMIGNEEPDGSGKMGATWVEYTRECAARREWEENMLDRFWTVFHPAGDISRAEASMANFMNDVLAERKSFSMPYDMEFKNLTSFGNVMAMKSLFHEHYYRMHVNHGICTILEMVVVTTPMEGALKLNAFMFGEASGGKSRLLEMLRSKSIPFIVIKNSGGSAKAEVTDESSRLMHLTVDTYDETPPELLGIGSSKGGPMERGKSTAENQGNTNAAAFVRDLIASGECHYRRNEKDAEGKFRMVTIVVRAERAHIFGSNSDYYTDLAANAQLRCFPVNVNSSERSDISFPHTISRETDADTIAAIKAYETRFRRDQLLFYLVATWQRMKILPKWTTNVSDSYLIAVLELAARRGLPGIMDPRRFKRTRRLVAGAALFGILYDFLDGPHRMMQPGEWSWKKFLEIRTCLVTTQEHVIWAMTANAAEWSNPAIGEVVSAIVRHFQLGASAGKEVRQQLPVHETAEAAAAASRKAQRILDELGKKPGKKTATERALMDHARAVLSGTLDTTGPFGTPKKTTSTSVWVPEEGERSQPANTEKNYYFNWSDTNLPVPVSNAARARKFAHEIESVMHSKIPAARLVGIIVNWLDAIVPEPDPTMPKSKTSHAFCFEPGHAGCERLRINKKFLNSQIESLIISCVQEVLDMHGFDDHNYIRGDMDSLPYVHKLMTRTDMEARHSFPVLNMNATNPKIESALKQMVESAEIIGAKADNHKCLSLVEKKMQALSKATRWQKVGATGRVVTVAVAEHIAFNRILGSDLPSRGKAFRQRCMMLHEPWPVPDTCTRIYPIDIIYRLGVSGPRIKGAARERRMGHQKYLLGMRFISGNIEVLRDLGHLGYVRRVGDEAAQVEPVWDSDLCAPLSKEQCLFEEGERKVVAALPRGPDDAPAAKEAVEAALKDYWKRNPLPRSRVEPVPEDPDSDDDDVDEKDTKENHYGEEGGESKQPIAESEEKDDATLNAAIEYMNAGFDELNIGVAGAVSDNEIDDDPNNEDNWLLAPGEREVKRAAVRRPLPVPRPVAAAAAAPPSSFFKPLSMKRPAPVAAAKPSHHKKKPVLSAAAAEAAAIFAARSGGESDLSEFPESDDDEVAAVPRKRARQGGEDTKRQRPETPPLIRTESAAELARLREPPEEPPKSPVPFGHVPGTRSESSPSTGASDFDDDDVLPPL